MQVRSLFPGVDWQPVENEKKEKTAASASGVSTTASPSMSVEQAAVMELLSVNQVAIDWTSWQVQTYGNRDMVK